MTGRDKAEQVARALFVCKRLREVGLTPISPVICERVAAEPGVALQPGTVESLRANWRWDKHIIRRVAHVVLIDGADEGSVGVAREYALNRYCLWKPTVLLWNVNRGLTVSKFEDDLSTDNLQTAITLILQRFSTPARRRIWRLRMLLRSLPTWIFDQIYAWR